MVETSLSWRESGSCMVTYCCKGSYNLVTQQSRENNIDRFGRRGKATE